MGDKQPPQVEQEQVVAKPQPLKEAITVGEAVTWWTKNKQYVYMAVVAIVSMFGGNQANNIGSLVPDFASGKELKDLAAQVDTLNTSLTKLQAARCTCQQSPPQVKEEAFTRDYNHDN